MIGIQCTQSRVDLPRAPADLEAIHKSAVFQHLHASRLLLTCSRASPALLQLAPRLASKVCNALAKITNRSRVETFGGEPNGQSPPGARSRQLTGTCSAEVTAAFVPSLMPSPCPELRASAIASPAIRCASRCPASFVSADLVAGSSACRAATCEACRANSETLLHCPVDSWRRLTCGYAALSAARPRFEAAQT